MCSQPEGRCLVLMLYQVVSLGIPVLGVRALLHNVSHYEDCVCWVMLIFGLHGRYFGRATMRGDVGLCSCQI